MNGSRALKPPTGTMSFVTVVAAVRNGLHRLRLPVPAAVRMWNISFAGNSPMIKAWEPRQAIAQI